MDLRIQKGQNYRVWDQNTFNGQDSNEWFEFKGEILKLKTQDLGLLEKRQKLLNDASERLSLNFTEELCNNQPEVLEKLIDPSFHETLHNLNLILGSFNKLCKRNNLGNKAIDEGFR